MFMDRSRSPFTENYDNSMVYKFGPSNHTDAGGIGAEVTNIITKSGQVRAMNMTAVWNKPDFYSQNFFDNTGYAEASYRQYVDDDMASQWW